MSNIKVLGIDLAKDVFQLHGTDVKGKQVLSKRLNRQTLAECVTQLQPCLIGMEACVGAFYWAR
ncbi:MAG: IS110 family transposase, partial [Nanoarchaeota archaeon]